MKYRVLETPSLDVNHPIRYVAQRQTIFGLWVRVSSMSWSYNARAAEDYIHDHHRARTRQFPEQFAPRVNKEIEL